MQIRERASGKVVSEIANTGFGDAIIFRLDKGLQHRLTDMQGAVPKTAFAGWFEPGPLFHEFVRETASAMKSSDREA